MAYLKAVVKLFKRVDNQTWASSGVIITDAYNIQLVNGFGELKDSFSFQLLNANNKFFASTNYFEIGDEIRIYLLRNEDTADDNTNLAFDGIITEPPIIISDGGKMLIIKGKSRIESLFESVVFVDKQNATPPEVAEYIIGLVNNDNSNFQVTWASTNPTLRSDSSAHDTYNFNEGFKQAYLILEKVASTVYTEDGNYIFYLDTDNNFHFTYRTGTSAGTITEGVEPLSIKIRYKEQILNYLIINVGQSPDGSGNTTPFFDAESIARFGSKKKVITETNNISEDLMQSEITNNPNSFDPAEYGWFPTTAALSAGYTTYWVSSGTDLGAPACTSGSVVTGINTKKKYNSAVRREAEWRGEKMAQTLIEKYSRPEFTAAIEVPRTLDYGGANLYTINVPSYNVSNKNLRLVQITHDFWTTLLTFDEDKPTGGPS